MKTLLFVLIVLGAFVTGQNSRDAHDSIEIETLGEELKQCRATPAPNGREG